MRPDFETLDSISEFFLILFVFFITTNHVTGILKLQMYLRGAMMKRTKKTGPNDAKRVVWAISDFFKILFVFFYNY